MGNGTVRKHVVRLSAQQREELEAIVRSLQATLLKGRRARVLLLSDVDHNQGRRCDWQIAEIVGLTEKQVKRIRHSSSSRDSPASFNDSVDGMLIVPARSMARLKLKSLRCAAASP
ncbi:hypothetical protein [Lacunimicrobium album]